jgi:hypothetical protein
MVKESSIAVHIGYVLLHAQCSELSERRKAYAGSWDT